MEKLENRLRQGMSLAAKLLRAEKGLPLNIQMPTLGGKQFWLDEYVFAGWRIQSNLYSGHCRLLNPDDERLAWGSYENCEQAFGAIRKEQKILQPHLSGTGEKHLVVMVHGITRSGDTFDHMRKPFEALGYEVAAITYPSTRAFIVEHAQQLARLLGRRPDIERVSFVTHSMGGLVVRYLLARAKEWGLDLKLGRVVMIAPPNQGSAIAQWMRDYSYYRLIYGKSGQELVPQMVSQIPIPDCDVAVIAGGLSDGKGYNPLLPGDDDGIVSVEEARLTNCIDFIVMPGLHSIICRQQGIIVATFNYIRWGQFENRSEYFGQIVESPCEGDCLT
ncbi:esterase/lipase family protein [Kiloniella laminariae]|uniref:esterase/lipase family protein n=1 Tax=Kiloniella laminariae TaxID=454162 RepID=UPI000379EFBB|nr:alpha/beta fold hydrolase [Kiloniella laminariae]